jgi:hypothetical protein
MTQIQPQKKVYLQSTGSLKSLLVQVWSSYSDLLSNSTNTALEFKSIYAANKYMKQNNRVGKYKAIKI